MGGSSQPQPPSPITPGQAAQAAVGTAGAGELMSVANQPIEQYANLYSTQQLGPAMTKTQQALAGQAAMQSAQQQQAIQAQVDPLAYAQRQMRMAAANARLGQLTSTDPSKYTFNAPGAFQVPGTQGLTSPADLSAQARAIASNLALASVSKTGANPQLTPGAGQPVAQTPAQSYWG